MAEKNPVTQLRFTSKKQKLAIKKMAVKNGRSLNAEINQAIDFYLTYPYMKIETKTIQDVK